MKTVSSVIFKVFGDKIFLDDLRVKRKIDTTAPKESFHILYITLFCIGILLLLPYNFFTTANAYWMYKFRNVTLESSNLTEEAKRSENRTWMQVQFASWLTIVSMTTSLVVLVIMTIFGFVLRPKISLIFSIATFLSLFVVIAVFVTIDTDDWQYMFFIKTMIICAGISAMKSFFNISIYSLTSRIPPEYFTPYLIGQGMAGIFSAVLQIISLAISASPITSAMIYFWCGVSFIVISLILFIVSSRTLFYKHYMKTESDDKKKLMTFCEVKEICKSIWTSLVVMALITGTLIPVYPAVTFLVKSEGEGTGTPWTDTFFVPVCTFLNYTVSEVVGRIIASMIKKRINGVILVIITFIRMLIYIPSIMMCNAQPRSHQIPVIFPHDWQYAIVISTFGASCGFLAFTAFSNIEGLVSDDKKMEAYSILSTSNGVVLAISSFLSQVCVHLL